MSGLLLLFSTVLLKNATDNTKCDAIITEYDNYYKIRLLLQNVLAYTRDK